MPEMRPRLTKQAGGKRSPKISRRRKESTEGAGNATDPSPIERPTSEICTSNWQGGRFKFKKNLLLRKAMRI